MTDDLRHRIARMIWDAMVNDETPDDETLWRDGYLDAADALLAPLSDAAVMRAYALLVEAGWLPPNRNGTVDDVRAAIEATSTVRTDPKP